MASWVYIFSKFTSEALLFEALAIFLLGCGYTAFWVLRKRRYGAVENAVPSGPVKTYLNQLILNSEQLRLQLFGLLAASDQSSGSLYRLVGQGGPMPGGGAALSDPNAVKKLSALELKLLEQSKILEETETKKNQLEVELTEAKNSLELSIEAIDKTVTLEKKVQDLEDKLSEYSVIEDDLANLKRLQQENNVLKATLTSNGITLPSGAPPPPPEGPPPPKDPGTGGSAEGGAPPSDSAPGNEAAKTPEQAEGSPPAEASSPGDAPADPEAGKPAEESEAQATESAAAAAGDPNFATEKGPDDKSEQEMVSEFEKMLKS